jgi:hypothetical protein
LDTTATVTVPVELLLPLLAPAVPALEPPPLEHAAASVASATAQPAAASFLEKKEDLDELINEPPRMRMFRRDAPPTLRQVCSYERHVLK